VKVTEATQKKIQEAKKADPALNNVQLGQKFKLDRGTIRKILSKSPVSGKMADLEDIVESNEITGDTWAISLPRTPIHTLEQLVEHCNIDLEVWDVERWVANQWQVATKDTEGDVTVTPLYQVKAFLRRKLFQTTEEYIIDNARLRSQVEKLKIKVRTESEMTKRLAQNHAGYADFMDNIKEFTDKFGDFSLPKTLVGVPDVIVPLLKPDHTEDAVLLISDTHYGDKIRKEDTSGFQEFDLEISGNRTGYIAAKAKEVLSLHRMMYPLDTLHIWFGGDIANGALHETEVSNELNVIEQVHFSYHMLKFLVEDLLTLTEKNKKGQSVINKINMLFTVGNHTRIDVKMPYKLQARRTFDWLIYQMLIERFSGNPNITIKTDLSPFIFENIRGHRHLFCHGMQVGYKNSPDAQGKSVSRFMTLARALFDSPQWRKENGIEGETFSRACIGDIHVPVSFPRFLSNGSLNGQNELGVNWQLEPIPAGMQIFGVSDRHQETWKYFLECTHVQRENPNAYAAFSKSYANELNR
jgi:hypothetical protein